MATANNFPSIYKEGNLMILPYNCIEEQVTKEDGTTRTQYKYQLHKEQFKGFDANNLNYWQQVVIKLLNQDNQNYIYSHCDQGTQASLQAIFNDTETTQATKDKIQAIWNWIRKTDVLPYYYIRKNEIRNTTTIDELIQVSWNFSQFDATKPSYTLEDIISA